jgi:hypothetical protein
MKANSSTHRACNEERQHPHAAPRSEHIPSSRTTDATDTALLGCRFYGCLVPQLYNTFRPHSSLAYRPPAPEAWPINNKGYGEVETATRFLLSHAPDCGGGQSINPAAPH